MIYSVRHTTTFRYEPAVRESVMEVRLQPRSDGDQRCLSFTLDVDPAANIMQYRDFTGNTVHHFDIAGTHTHGESHGAVGGGSAIRVRRREPPTAATGPIWTLWSPATITGRCFCPATSRNSSPPLEQLAQELGCERRGKSAGPADGTQRGDLQVIRLRAQQHQGRFAD